LAFDKLAYLNRMISEKTIKGTTEKTTEMTVYLNIKFMLSISAASHCKEVDGS
jgi:hypothetical protein